MELEYVEPLVIHLQVQFKYLFQEGKVLLKVRLQHILEFLKQRGLLSAIDFGQVAVLLIVSNEEELQILVLPFEGLDDVRVAGYVVLDIQNVPVSICFDCLGPVRVYQCVICVLK